MTDKTLMESKLASNTSACRSYWDQRACLDMTDEDKVEMSPRTQRCRFEVFLRDHDLRGRSVLDIGSGAGGFLEHLRRRGIECQYIGFDLSPKMTELCRAKFPGVEFVAGDLAAWQPERTFDYTVAFAIHNIKAPHAWEQLVSTTRRQFAMCRVAAHLSILTDRHKGLGPHIQAWRAERTLTMALEITPYVALHHGYLPNDFSLTLYRQPLIDTRQDFRLD